MAPAASRRGLKMRIYARFVKNELFILPAIGYLFDRSNLGNPVFFGFGAWLFWQFAVEIEVK